MYRKSLTAWQKERKHARAMAGVEARRRKRMELTLAMRDVGGITTDGILGAHSIRFLAYGVGEPHYAVTVDGKHRQARTDRGIFRLLAKMVFRRIKNPEGVLV